MKEIKISSLCQSTSRLTDDITLIRDGMGEKIAAMIQFLTMFLVRKKSHWIE